MLLVYEIQLKYRNMKKLILSFFALLSFTAFAQSLSISPANYYYAAGGEECSAHFDVTNISDQDVSVMVTKTETPVDANNSLFCWGTSCYPPQTQVSSDPITIAAGESSSDFTGYIYGIPDESSFVINYCFWLENDPTDKVCADITYTSLSEYIGVDELEEVYTVYPNPANNVLHLDYSSETSASFVLYDMLGSKVYTEELTGATSIDLTSFESGIYFYTFSAEGRETEVQKLIIAH